MFRSITGAKQCLNSEEGEACHDIVDRIYSLETQRYESIKNCLSDLISGTFADGYDGAEIKDLGGTSRSQVYQHYYIGEDLQER